MSDKPKEWITVNGAHVPLDEEGGLAGKVGEKIARESGEAKPDGEKAAEREETPPEGKEIRQGDQPEDSDAGEAEEGGEATEPEDKEGEEDESSPPGRDFAFYREMADGNAFKGTRLFFRNELQDTSVEPKNGPLAGKNIGFIGADWKKFKQNMNWDEVKAEAIQYVPDVIRDGRCFGPVEPFDENRGGGRFTRYYYFQKDIPMKDENGNPRRLIVDVGETKEGKLEYVAHSFQHNQSHKYQIKRDELRKLGLPVEDKKRADCQLRNRGCYPRTADPPGGIFLRSGHRPSAPEKRIQQAEEMGKAFAAEDKKRLISDDRTNGIIIRPDNPPGGIFLRSGHRKPAFDETVRLAEAEVNRIIAEGAREGLRQWRRERLREREAAAMDALDPATMRALEIQRFQDGLPASGPFAYLRNITVAG